AYTIDEISVNGQANANTADLTVTYQITITAAREEAVPVRLGLGGGVLRLPVNHRGEGRQYISYQGGGYVCWLNAKADTKHSLTVRWAARQDQQRPAAASATTAGAHRVGDASPGAAGDSVGQRSAIPSDR
ncbi:MAG: hypothetical protein QF805_22390, partial [Pirellulaceae bacterium]|nr:hypothetical protein [Pirellulaceae bacterium]